MADYVRTDGIGRNAVTVSQLTPEELEEYRKKYPPRPDKKKMRQRGLGGASSFNKPVQKKEEPVVISTQPTEQQQKQLDKETYFRMKKEGSKDKEIKDAFKMSNAKFYAWKDDHLTEEERQQTRQKKGGMKVAQQKQPAPDLKVVKEAEEVTSMKSSNVLDQNEKLQYELKRLKEENKRLEEAAPVKSEFLSEENKKFVQQLQEQNNQIKYLEKELEAAKRENEHLAASPAESIHFDLPDWVEASEYNRVLEELSLWKGLVLLRERQ